jgi:hypothetical protein
MNLVKINFYIILTMYFFKKIFELLKALHYTWFAEMNKEEK